MEGVAISKMQAIELAKAIAEARDAEIAFLLQVQEIVKSTTTLPDGVAAAEDLEDPSQESLSAMKLKDSETTGSGDTDKAAALNLSVDELESFVDETEETQLSLQEAARLAHLDAIQEHDALFARSLANMPRRAWVSIGDNVEDPFMNNQFAPPDAVAIEVDGYESVLSLLGNAFNLRDDKRRRPRHGAGRRNNRYTVQSAKLPAIPLTSREISPRRLILDSKQHGKGKMDELQELEDNEDIDPAAAPPTFDSLSIKAGLPLNTGFGLETGMDTSDYGLDYCQICFEATVTTSFFLTLEGCGHQFCVTCIKRHAEARILVVGQMHVTCLRAECPTIIPHFQLILVLSSPLLEVLTRRQIEAAIPETDRMYCPFRDCSALLIKPSSHVQDPSSSAHPPPTTFGCVECEACHRAFCLECAVPWHADMSCGEYKANLKNRQLLGDEKLLQLAGKQKWRRCKKCGRVIELESGCYHISCLCGHGFCYTCGAPWQGKDGKSCKCPTWNEFNLYQAKRS